MNKDNKMRLCLFWFPPGSHPGGWRMQDAIAAAESDFKVYLDVARLAEAAKIDAIFFADTAAVQPVAVARARIERKARRFIENQGSVGLTRRDVRRDGKEPNAT